ncbi:hypothetical protein BDV97DRAFT_322310 [Delphinella strobiligena]|nr:hypothetical protein BDV97DRAFT_322310 [Delphinella strobiligena]
MRLYLTCLAFLASTALADLHWSGLCVTHAGGQNIYHADATEKACADYKARNTGTHQWDTCSDCEMSTVSGLSFCHSEGKHIGGDQLSDYCTAAGADGSLAD